MGAQLPDYQKLKALWTSRRERIRAMLDQGISQTAIAKRLGISRARVCQIVGKRGA